MTPAQQYAEALKAQPARLKFRNVPTELDGYRFDSKKEARRYSELKLMLLAGQIADLKVHPRFPLDVNGKPVTRYEGDFSYVACATGARVVEDVKSPITRKHPLYIVKARLFEAIHGFPITET